MGARKVKRSVKKLTNPELLEFKMRLSIVDQARAHFLMIEEAHSNWLKQVAKKYNLPQRFNVDGKTGTLEPAKPIDVSKKGR